MADSLGGGKVGDSHPEAAVNAAVSLSDPVIVA